MRYISIDLETTGLDDENNQIIEFGAVLEDTNNPLPLDDLPTYHAYVTHPNGVLTGDVFALSLNAGIISKLKNQKELEHKYNFIRVEDLAESFLSWLQDHGFKLKTKNKGCIDEYECSESFTVAGKNFIGFDKRFLNRVPDFNKLIKIDRRVIDPATLFVDWDKDNRLPALDQCKERAGIEGAVTHLAVDDAKDVIELLRTKY